VIATHNSQIANLIFADNKDNKDNSDDEEEEDYEPEDQEDDSPGQEDNDIEVEEVADLEHNATANMPPKKKSISPKPSGLPKRSLSMMSPKA